MTRLPILNYHGIEKERGEYSWSQAEKPYVVSFASFEEQLHIAIKSGFSTLRLRELENWTRTPSPYPLPLGEGGERFDFAQRPELVEGEKGEEVVLNASKIVFTFDDGHVSHLQYAAPALRRNHLHAIFFVPAGLIGEKTQMGISDLQSLVRDGFEIGSHGFNHVALSHLPKAKLTGELTRSKKVLEDHLGIEVISLSVPKGFYSRRIREAAVRVGYRFVFTSHFDLNEHGQDPLVFRRMVVMSHTDLSSFSQMLTGELGCYRRFVEWGKEKAREFLGPSFYEGLAFLKRFTRSVVSSHTETKGGNF